MKFSKKIALVADFGVHFLIEVLMSFEETCVQFLIFILGWRCDVLQKNGFPVSRRQTLEARTSLQRRQVMS